MARLVALIAVAAWSIVPPYVAELDVPARVEIADHLVPALVTIAAALYVIRLERAGAPASTPALLALGICAIGGLWETATHLTLLLDAGEAGRPVGRVLVHVVPGPVIAALALWLLWDRSGDGQR